MFKNRIKDDDGLLCVDLTDAETDLFAMSGDAIAYVDDRGRIERFVYIRDIAMGDIVRTMNEALQHGNAWHGWCSLPQFCDPQRIVKTPHLKRVLQLIFTRNEVQSCS